MIADDVIWVDGEQLDDSGLRPGDVFGRCGTPSVEH